MDKMQSQVREFHEKFGHEVGATPAVRFRELRTGLIAEETLEVLDAIKANDLVDTVDGLCDLVYVCYGAAVTFGVDLESHVCPAKPEPGAAVEIRDGKVWGRRILDASANAVTAIYIRDLVDAVEGLSRLISEIWLAAAAFGIDLEPYYDEVHRTNMLKVGGSKREDGKILKPKGWQPPRIAEMLEQQKAKAA